MKVSIDGNFKEVERAIAGLPSKIVTPAMIQSINRTSTRAASKGRRAIRNVTGIKLKATKSRVHRSTKKTTKKNLERKIFVRTLFDAPYSKAFNKSEIKKSSSLNRRSFTATMKSGKFSRWQRVGKERLPIEELKVPLHPQGTKAAEKAIKNTVQQMFVKELSRSINLKLSKMKR